MSSTTSRMAMMWQSGGSDGERRVPFVRPTPVPFLPLPRLTVVVRTSESTVAGNWDGPRELFPTIAVAQETGEVFVTYQSVRDRRRETYGLTHWHGESLSPDGRVLLVRGMCGIRNGRHPRCGGRQQFCFVIFFGDSGHIYIHRATASPGWMECDPAEALGRLRKLGIGAEKRVRQQGDILLKPANGQAYPDAEFQHETMGAGHHRFAAPVLYADGEHGRQYRLTEPMVLRHHAVDGIEHPPVLVPAGTWIVGTTSHGLRHANKRD